MITPRYGALNQIIDTYWDGQTMPKVAVVYQNL